MRRFIAYGAFVLAACVVQRAGAEDARPAVLVPALSDKAVVMVHLAGVDKKPDPADIEAGALVNAANHSGPDTASQPRS